MINYIKYLSYYTNYYERGWTITDVNEKRRRHFVDIFIPFQNKRIEVKSTWTFTTQKVTIFLKQQAAKELGYLYEIWVYDGKGNKVEFYA